MNVDELENIASRLRMLVRDAWEFGQNRDTFLAIVDDYANELQDQADELMSELVLKIRESANG